MREVDALAEPYRHDRRSGVSGKHAGDDETVVETSAAVER
jgi:hypothetical protein